jgi:prepilin-type processing-associated H-X9-DG protein
MDSSPLASVGDYAASIGTTGYDYTVTLPDSLPIPSNGVFRAVNGVRFAEITDGLSNTLMVGEKHVPQGKEGAYPWDCGIYDGHNPICNTRSGGPGFPVAILPEDPGLKFGSHHPGVCQFVFCDGSVRPLEKFIDPVILGLLSQRNDRQAIPSY